MKINDIVFMLSEFLAEQRESVDSGWAEVGVDDRCDLVRIIDAIIEAKWQADPSGDRPMYVKVIDRSKYRLPPFLPVPHDFFDASASERKEIFDTLTHNVDIAIGELRHFMRANNFR